MKKESLKLRIDRIDQYLDTEIKDICKTHDRHPMQNIKLDILFFIHHKFWKIFKRGPHDPKWKNNPDQWAWIKERMKRW